MSSAGRVNWKPVSTDKFGYVPGLRSEADGIVFDTDSPTLQLAVGYGSAAGLQTRPGQLLEAQPRSGWPFGCYLGSGQCLQPEVAG